MVCKGTFVIKPQQTSLIVAKHKFHKQASACSLLVACSLAPLCSVWSFATLPFWV